MDISESRIKFGSQGLTKTEEGIQAPAKNGFGHLIVQREAESEKEISEIARKALGLE